MQEVTLVELKTQSFAIAQKLGWGEKVIEVPEMIALLHSECTEALEAFRNHEPVSWTDESGKPQGIGSEFADIAIRLGHYAQLLNIDLSFEVRKKWAYNLTREHRHGNKAI